jgi:hypothetical protein
MDLITMSGTSKKSKKAHYLAWYFCPDDTLEDDVGTGLILLVGV